MDLQGLERIKQTAIKAMFSDDHLMELLVLKGGNALDIIHKIAQRGSVDLDFSMESEFSKNELGAIRDKIRKVLEDSFREEGYDVFDVSFEERPPFASPENREFWGGYRIEFKVIEINRGKDFGKDVTRLRQNATVVGPNQRRRFRIEISKFEFCTPKQQFDLDGYTIYVYTPEMIVIEKIRAICQQMPEYGKIVNSSSQSPRARDFFDIYTVKKRFNINLTLPDNQKLLMDIFAAKHVPLNLIGKIKEQREYHRQDFPSVKDTVKPTIHLEDFDYYFEYLVNECEKLKTLWEI